MPKSTSAQMNFQTSMLFLLFSTLGKSQKKFVSRNTFLNLRYSQKLTDSLKEFFEKKKKDEKNYRGISHKEIENDTSLDSMLQVIFM